MDALQRAASDALRTLLDSQPTTPAKIAFAWRIAAGAALAKAGEPEWRRDDGVLVIRSASEAWRRELRRASPVLLHRLQELIGPGVVRRLVIE